MKTQTLALATSVLVGLGQAHMKMTDPAPFRAADPLGDMINPLDASGANFPCKGYLSDLGTDAGKPTAEWQAGQGYSYTIEGGANHGGGSCQASLSFDQGKTWKVIKSYVGGCVGQGTTSYDFEVPSDAPSGEAVFAWSWFNRIGNREMYMNCAPVTIKGGSSKRASALSDRPDMFVANVGNGCSTLEGKDVMFPNPGKDIAGGESSDTTAPEGSCASGGGTGGGSGGGDSGNGGASTGGDGTYQPPATTSAAAAPAPAPTSETPEQPAPTSIPGGVFITAPPSGETSAAPEPPASEPPVSKPSNGGANTSLVTVTRSAPGTGGQPVPTETPVTSPGDDGSSGESHEAGTACTNEGEWNCISGGSKFQRCASGTWSVVMSMASGTNCNSGKSQALVVSGSKRSLFRRALRDLADNI